MESPRLTMINSTRKALLQVLTTGARVDEAMVIVGPSCLVMADPGMTRTTLAHLGEEGVRSCFQCADAEPIGSPGDGNGARNPIEILRSRDERGEA
jgi:hypothetical protein